VRYERLRDFRRYDREWVRDRQHGFESFTRNFLTRHWTTVPIEESEWRDEVWDPTWKSSLYSTRAQRPRRFSPLIVHVPPGVSEDERRRMYTRAVAEIAAHRDDGVDHEWVSRACAMTAVVCRSRAA